MKIKKRLFLPAVLPLAVLLSACSTNITGTISGTDTTTIDPAQDTQMRTEGNTEIMPKTVLQIGDSFEHYPKYASGHLSCAVTGVRTVTEESECPEFVDAILPVTITEKIDFPDTDSRWMTFDRDGEIVYEVYFEQPEWFIEGGAIDRGSHIILVDLTVTNVDAKGLPYDENSPSTGGMYKDPYVFCAYWVAGITDLSDLWSDPNGYSFREYSADYFSGYGEYSDGIEETVINETVAIQILPGQTVNFTLGFLIGTDSDGSSKDLSKFFLYAGSDTYAETGTFIDLGLGDDDA